MRKAFKLVIGYILLLIIYSLVFMVLMSHEGQTQNANMLNALYWVVITILTIGYGDIVFHSPLGRIFSIIVGLSGVAIFYAAVLPIIITNKLEDLIRVAPSSLPREMQGHIIITGYSSILEMLLERLSQLSIPFLIVERSEEVARSIYKTYPTLWGDPSEYETLIKANINSARLFITNEKDELDAEVISSVREISKIEIIELVNNLASSKFLCFAGASRIISPKTLLGKFIAQIALPANNSEFHEAVPLFGELMLGELPIYSGSYHLKQNLTINELTLNGGKVVGIWKKGDFQHYPEGNHAIESNSMIMVAGNIEQLSQIRRLTMDTKRTGPLIIIGYGDVGKSVAKVLNESGLKPIIVDRKDLGDIPFVHFQGEASSEEILIEAGIREAKSIMILIDNDSDVIYSTLLVKNLNPSAFVVARAHRVESVKKIYRAGADFVASLPIVASHLLVKIIQNEEEKMALLYENLELKLFDIGPRSRLIGKSLKELDLAGKFKCSIVAIKREIET
ncbi:Calcium-gated potassium channel MthK [uncultured archaeon]|nr:Calcium-gated potassium channel MthK [uncultured archaeon]